MTVLRSYKCLKKWFLRKELWQEHLFINSNIFQYLYMLLWVSCEILDSFSRYHESNTKIENIWGEYNGKHSRKNKDETYKNSRKRKEFGIQGIEEWVFTRHTEHCVSFGVTMFQKFTHCLLFNKEKMFQILDFLFSSGERVGRHFPSSLLCPFKYEKRGRVPKSR